MYITIMAKKKFTFVTDSPIGPLGVTIKDGYLTGVEYIYGKSKLYDCSDSLAMEVQKQIQGYFTGSSNEFSIPMKYDGTDFQKRVWKAISNINHGQVRTYGDIASELDTSPRAVGNACRANPIPLVIPCHRVVAASGLGGFSGATSGLRMDAKRWLLEHEDAMP